MDAKTPRAPCLMGFPGLHAVLDPYCPPPRRGGGGPREAWWWGLRDTKPDRAALPRPPFGGPPPPLRRGGLEGQTACKPGSVVRFEKRGTVIPLDHPLLDGSRDQPGRLGPAMVLPEASLRRVVPIRSCSWRGLPCRSGRPVRGELLPHPFTLTPGTGPGAVCFLWRYPWGRPRRALPAAISPWSPDFPRPSCESRDRPAVWPDGGCAPRLRRRQLGLQHDEGW